MRSDTLHDDDPFDEDPKEQFQKVSKAAIGVLISGSLAAIVGGILVWMAASPAIGLWAVPVAIIVAIGAFYVVAAITGIAAASRGLF
ncbi:hypothetical protein ACFPYI_01730 [Halomarina salina]|uniref:Uncharacterized protein n=1 Tax=Halomarina salina TaxID=1872699 RepID=A0ABD5RHW3_9EURY|nr:hypothetical protein [Halomarina salina]